jgi:hypothetical protein
MNTNIQRSAERRGYHWRKRSPVLIRADCDQTKARNKSPMHKGITR